MTHPLAAYLTAKGVRKPRQRPEENIQTAAAAWMRLCVPPPPVGPAWSACNPLPGKRTKAQGARAKAMGLRAGVDDWFLLWRGGYYGIEWKAGRGSTSEAQDEWHRDVELCGCRWAVARSVDDLRAILRAWGMPTRETLP